MTRGFAYLSAYTFETLLIKAPLITLHHCNLLRIMYYDPPSPNPIIFMAAISNRPTRLQHW